MKTRDLTEGSIFKLLLVVAVPAIISGLLRFSYSFLDMLFIGHYSNEAGIASVGSASLYITYGYAVNFLTITGLGIKLTHSLGRKDMEAFNKYLNVGLVLNTTLSFVTFFVLFVFAKPLIMLIGLNDEQVIIDSIMYLRIFAVVFLFNFFNGVANRVLLSVGKSDVSLKINAVGILINIILDPIFIFGLDLNVIGAGIATLIAEMTVTAIYLVKFKDTFRNRRQYGFDKQYLKDILGLSSPYFYQRILFTFIGFKIGQSLVQFGDEVLVAQRVGFQVETLNLVVIGGLLQATSAFVGQNFGAKKYDRIKQEYKLALILGISYSILTSILFIVFSEEIVRIIIKDPNPITLKYTTMYLNVIAYGQVFGVLEMVGNGLYTGLGLPKIPTRISIAITPLRLVFAYYFANIYGPEAVFFGIFITTVMKGVVSFGYYYANIRKEIGVSIVSQK